MYADDHEENIVGMSTYRQGRDFWTGPKPVKGSTLTGQAKAEAEVKEGIRQGLLFPYASAVDAWHCPGDRRNRLPVGRGFAYDSYSGAGGLDGEDDSNSIRKYTQIPFPSRSYVFVEEADDRGWNLGSWIIDPSPTSYSWIDAVAIWHIKKSTLSFADGHSLTHKWVGDAIIKASDPKAAAKFGTTAKTPQDKHNVLYMKYGYTHKKMADWEALWAKADFHP
jgi:hypothetical protein